MSEDRAIFAVRVYFEDTDFSGTVYHAAYLKFFERARTEWLRARGIAHSALIEKGLFFAARRMEISWERPARIDDLVEIETRIAGLSGARVHLDQVMRRGEEVLVSARVEIVMVNRAGRPVRLPREIVSL